MENGIKKKEQFVFFQDKIDSLRKRNSDMLPHCQNCEVRLHCGGYCLGEVVNETGTLSGQKVVTCKAIRRLFRELGYFATPFKYLHP